MFRSTPSPGDEAKTGMHTVPRLATVLANARLELKDQSTSVRSWFSRVWIALKGPIRRGSMESDQYLEQGGEKVKTDRILSPSPSLILPLAFLDQYQWKGNHRHG
jgi:hypothetical protein